MSNVTTRRRAITPAATQPYAILPRRHRVARVAEKAIRAAKVHHGRCVSRTQHLLAMIEHGHQVEAAQLTVLAEDLRFVDMALDRAASDVDDVITVAQECAIVVRPSPSGPGDEPEPATRDLFTGEAAE